MGEIEDTTLASERETCDCWNLPGLHIPVRVRRSDGTEVVLTSLESGEAKERGGAL